MFRVDNINVYYGESHVIRDASFDSGVSDLITVSDQSTVLEVVLQHSRDRSHETNDF